MPVTMPPTERTAVSAAELESVREETIRALGIHFANDDLGMDELDRRLALAVAARSPADLTTLVADLPAIPSPRGASAFPPATAPAATRGPEVVSADRVASHGLVGAFMGGSARRGEWIVPRRLTVIAAMGGVELDLRQARFGPGVTEINVVAVMGGVEIVVPPGLRVESQGFAIMGGFDASGNQTGTRDAEQPTVRVTGLAVMGGVETRQKKPSAKSLERFEKRLQAILERNRIDPGA
jgi:hypothetical protein